MSSNNEVQRYLDIWKEKNYFKTLVATFSFLVFWTVWLENKQSFSNSAQKFGFTEKVQLLVEMRTTRLEDFVNTWRRGQGAEKLPAAALSGANPRGCWEDVMCHTFLYRQQDRYLFTK